MNQAMKRGEAVAVGGGTTVSSGALKGLFVMMGALPFMSTVKLPPYGNFLSEWMAAVAAVAVLGVLAWRGRHAEGRDHATIPVSALAFVGLAVLIAVQLSVKPPLYLASYLLPIAELGIAFALTLAGSALASRNRLDDAMDGLAIGWLTALVANACAWVLEISGYEIFMLHLVERAVPERAIGLVGQPNQLAVVAVLAWTAAFYRWTAGRLKLATYGSFTVLSALLVAASGSRAGLLCMLAVLVLSAATRAAAGPSPGDPRLVRRVLWGTAGLFLVFKLGWSLFATVAKSTAAPIAQQLGGATAPRLELLADGWNLWLKHPLIGTGHGQFSVRRMIDLGTGMLEPNATHAHNLVIQVLAEFGLVGALLCFVPLAFLLHAAWRRLRQPQLSGELRLAASIVLVLLVYSLFEYPLWLTYFLFPFALAAGALPQKAWTYKSSKGIGTVRAAVWMVVGIGCFVVLADYLRLQKIYTDVGRQRVARERTADPWINIPPEVADVARATLFPLLAEFMYVRTLEPDGAYMFYKRSVAERVMLGLPRGETLARYVAFSVVDGDTAEADRWLQKARTRNVDMFSQAVLALRVMAARQPALATYLKNAGLLG